MTKEEVVEKVRNMLNEEKFTRSALSSFSTAQFKEFDVVLQEVISAQSIDEVLTIAEEHLSHTKNSIIALYLAGMLSLSRQLIDDAALVSLVGIFTQNNKANIVRFICERMLDLGESKFALRTLADCYKADKDEEKMYDAWRRLVKIDFDEADIAKTLADHYEKESDIDLAVEYYKKALHRYINKNIFTNIREIWQKLLDYEGTDIDYFLTQAKRIAKNISEDKACVLLNDLYGCCMKKNDINNAIYILKIILSYEEKDSEARRLIVDAYRQKYAGHSQLEEYISISNLTESWRTVNEAISDFEKHIAFDKGSFVYHKSWGVGRIASVSGDDITIDFAKKRAHTMSLKMAIDALQTLSKDHIWVLKSIQKKEKLHDKVKEDVEWTLKIVIRSFGNACDMKKIKAELVPSILSLGEWTSWSGKAKVILKTNSIFGVSPTDIDIFTVRERPIGLAEKLYNEFKAEDKFFNRVAILRSYVDREDFEIEADQFTEMFNYFTVYLKSTMQVNEYVISSYLLAHEFAARFPQLSGALSVSFITLFEQINDVIAIFVKIKDADIRRDFLKQIKLLSPNWPGIYIKLFPHAQLGFILESLLENGHEDKLIALTSSCFDNYRDRESRETAVWLYTHYREAPWFKKTNLTLEKELITFIYILDVTYREVDNHHDTAENRKTNKAVFSLLFPAKPEEESMLYSYIDSADKESIMRVCTLIDDVKELDPEKKMKLRERILQKYPDFKFYSGDIKEFVTRGLIVTTGKYDEKQRQLKKILEEEVPANSKEIAFALSLGDLRENAEYKAAKEKQEILNSTVAKLKDEIDRSQLFDPKTINTNRVSFGTVVSLENASTKISESFTILGPWESDPDNKVISYLSPFGNAVMNKKPGESFTFAIGNDKVTYNVKEISAAQF
jgi:transcription elongation factor GreA